MNNNLKMPMEAKKMKLSKMMNKEISAKMDKIMTEGVRRNTHAPVSKSNPRRPVSKAQAYAIARDMTLRRKGKIKNKGRQSKLRRIKK